VPELRPAPGPVRSRAHRLGRGDSPRRGSRRAGFTLVELLIVVGILALLLMMVAPSLGRAKDLARVAVCLTNHRSIAAAVISYHAEHETFPYNYGYYYSSDPAKQKWALGYISPYLGEAPGTWNLACRDEGQFPHAYICPAADLDLVYQYNMSTKYHACVWTNVAIRANRGFNSLFNDWTGQGHPPGWDGNSGGEARFTGKCCPRCGNWRSVYCPRMATVPNPGQTVFSGCTNNDFPPLNPEGGRYIYCTYDSYGRWGPLYSPVYYPGFWHMRTG